MRAKYVMTSKGPILFPETFGHDDFLIFEPISAGFVIITDNSCHTYGKSISLNKEPDTYDSTLINMAFEIFD